MKYIYGPVHSRRLGLSLGLSLTPYKICNFDCVYCQLGRTKEKATERKEYSQPDEILNELKSWLQNNLAEAKDLGYITISGLGEPTLHIKLDGLINKIKGMSHYPVAVITNSSLLADKEVRQSLLGADLIVPSLDAVSPEIFLKVDRPGQKIKIDGVIQGLVSLRREFRGKIWLEIMLVKGLNDSLDEAKKLKEVISRINPDKIQLNSPVRSTTEAGILAVDKNKLEKFKEILGARCEII